MAEWSNAAVLKTVEGHTSGGSNPSFSAKETRNESCGFLVFLKLLGSIFLVRNSFFQVIQFQILHCALNAFRTSLKGGFTCRFPSGIDHVFQSRRLSITILQDMTFDILRLK